MEAAKFRLNSFPGSGKWAATLYLLLVILGFSVAALMSHNTYNFNHHKTIQFYLGDEAEGGMAMPKLYSQLLQTAHVHSFSMPVVFLPLWLGLVFTPISGVLKKLLMAGGAISIFLYNTAPFLLRYQSGRWVNLFTIGGIGLFLFSLIPALLLSYEVWRGFNCESST